MLANSSTLWAPFFLSMLLAWLCDRQSSYVCGVLGEKQYVYKNKLFYALLLLTMCLFIGLRKWCNDTGTYRDAYEYLVRDTGPLLQNISWAIGDSPLFQIANTILKRIGFSSQSFLMFYAFVTNGLYLWFLRKYSKDFWFSIFLLWTMGVYLFSAAGMRQAVAIAIGLVGIDRAFQKKWIPFVFWILVGSMFHPYVALFLVAPLMQFRPWTHKTWISIGVFAVLGFAMRSFMGMLLDITSVMGKNYAVDDFSGEGVNLFRLLVVWAPIVLSLAANQLMRNSNDNEENLFMNFSMLNAEIMFIALFGTANYFARLANYFLIFQTLALPWMLKFFDSKSRRILKSAIVACYMVYFIFANVILTPFNRYFARMTLWEYLQSLF